MRGLLIGLSGPRGVGKSTAAKILGLDHGFAEVALAEPIYRDVLRLFTKWAREMFEDRAWKEAVCPHYKIRPRDALRMPGEHTRILAANAYIDHVAEQVEPWLSRGRDFVVSDVRMDREANWVRSRGGVIVHVKRDGCAWSDEHVTERGPAVWPDDWVLHNPGDVALYREQVADLVEGLTLSRCPPC